MRLAGRQHRPYRRAPIDCRAYSPSPPPHPSARPGFRITPCIRAWCRDKKNVAGLLHRVIDCQPAVTADHRPPPACLVVRELHSGHLFCADPVRQSIKFLQIRPPAERTGFYGFFSVSFRCHLLPRYLRSDASFPDIVKVLVNRCRKNGRRSCQLRKRRCFEISHFSLAGF